MEKRLLHTPEGVRDIYGEEYAKKLKVQELLHRKIRSFGFHDIQTPTFEYFDVFSREIGTVPSKELYKFFDKEGNTLALRPDFTPSMARCAAKYFCEEEIGIRFSYVGNTFINTSELQGKLKEITEMGAELIGDSSVEADAEMISLAVEALASTGLQDFQISIGQVEFFKGLCEAAGLMEETERKLRDLIANKNYFGAEDLLSAAGVNGNAAKVLLKVTDLFGSIDVLKEARELVLNPRALSAIDNLETLYELLSLYGVEKYVSFDLGMLSKYNYYTGVIFRGYTYGVGDAVLKGGRYDTLLHQFGKDSAAIGFMVILDDLMEAIAGQKIVLPVEPKGILILYQKPAFRQALSLAKKMRADGLFVELMQQKEGKDARQYKEFAQNNRIERMFTFDTDGALKEEQIHE